MADEGEFSILPSKVVVAPGGVVIFTAIRQVEDGTQQTPDRLRWHATGGRIGARGLYRAGKVEGSYEVTVQAGDETATALVEVDVKQAAEKVIARTACRKLPGDGSGGYFSIRSWQAGRQGKRGARARIIARVYCSDISHVVLLGIPEDGEPIEIARRRCRDRDTVTLQGKYPAYGVRWLELRMVNGHGQVIARTKRLL